MGFRSASSSTRQIVERLIAPPDGGGGGGRDIIEAPPRSWQGRQLGTGGDRQNVDLSAGGKAPRPSCSRRILKPSQPLLQNRERRGQRMAVTTHLGGYPAVGSLWRRDPQHQPTPKGQGLGGRSARARDSNWGVPHPSTYRRQTVLAGSNPRSEKTESARPNAPATKPSQIDQLRM